MMEPYPPEEMTLNPVSKKGNQLKNNTPDIIKPINIEEEKQKHKTCGLSYKKSNSIQIFQ